jgi:succinate dehydrogenase/fumarate reductase flavoprotein subunit
MRSRSALVREESRGAHSRLDFPETRDEWAAVNVVVRRDGDTEIVSTSPLPEMTGELRELATAGGAH